MTAESPRENYTAVTTSAEGHEAVSDALSPASGAFPGVWLIPAGELWPHAAALVQTPGDPRGSWRCTNGAWLTDGEVFCHGQCLVPVGPLLALLADLNSLAADAAAYSEEGAVWVRSSADRLRAVLALLGIDTGEES